MRRTWQTLPNGFITDPANVLCKALGLFIVLCMTASCGGSGSSSNGGGFSASSDVGNQGSTGTTSTQTPTNPDPDNSPKLELRWQAPEENVDGSPVSGINEYRIYYGESSGQYDYSEDVPGSSTSHTMYLPVGEYYLVMTAVDVEGDESGYSNEVSLWSE